MMTDRQITQEKILLFLQQVEDLFPVSLSQKQDLQVFAEKIASKATICTVTEGDRILSMAAGYTDNVLNNQAYLSIVATLPEAQGHGYASKLVREFIGIAQDKGLSAVHLYAVETNISAVSMYRKLGFAEYKIPDESRPDDLHLIYRIK